MMVEGRIGVCAAKKGWGEEEAGMQKKKGGQVEGSRDPND